MKCATENCPNFTANNSKYCKEHKAIARQKWLAMVKEKSVERNNRDKFFAALWEEATQAGMIAGETCKPIPMVVEQHANVLDDNSPVIERYHVADGPCGFASIVVHPGNSSFALWCKANHGARRAYYGGMTVRNVFEFGQSYERKRVFANAFASVLNKHGIKAYAESRLD